MTLSARKMEIPTARARRPALAVGMALVVTIALVGCATPSRLTLTDVQLQQRVAADTAQDRDVNRDIVNRIIARLERKMESPRAALELDFLALSGGGDHGAFGAGFLVGWGSAADPKWRRPDFDAVSGVSTGALLAPFAYLGTDDAYRRVEELYRNPKKDWVRKRGPLFFLPFNLSFMTIPGLERDIRSLLDKPFMEKLATEFRQGKVLLVSATDLDLGRQKFWDVGVEAQTAAATGNCDKVQRIMLASTAIPAVFPPVEIDGSLYADGGVVANVFLRPDANSPEVLFARWKAAHPDKPLPKLRYWVIINKPLGHPPKTVQANWRSLAEPSLAIALRSATVAQVRWLAAQADYVNARWGANIEVRVAAIPDEWRPPVEGHFKRETMVSLADLGRKMGADPKSWMLWTAPDRVQARLSQGSAMIVKNASVNR